MRGVRQRGETDVEQQHSKRSNELNYETTEWLLRTVDMPSWRHTERDRETLEPDRRVTDVWPEGDPLHACALTCGSRR